LHGSKNGIKEEKRGKHTTTYQQHVDSMSSNDRVPPLSQELKHDLLGTFDGLDHTGLRELLLVTEKEKWRKKGLDTGKNCISQDTTQLPSLQLIITHKAEIQVITNLTRSCRCCTPYIHIVDVESLLQIILFEQSRVDNEILYLIPSLATVVDAAPINKTLTMSPHHRPKVLPPLLLRLLSPHPSG
jgi:hypothetical protein